MRSAVRFVALAALLLGAGVVRAGPADPFVGFGQAVRYGIAGGAVATGGGFGYGTGAGLGSILTGTTGVAVDLVSTPITVAGSLIGAVPGIPLRASDALIQNPLRSWAHDAGVRSDLFAETHPHLFSIVADDVMSTGTGLLAHVRGFGDGTGTLLRGVWTLRPKRVLGGLSSITVALVPRYGRFAGPGHGNQAFPPFWNAPDVHSKVHDAAYGPASGIKRWEADRRIVGELGRSIVSLEQQPGPFGQVYRVLEIGLFAIKAPIERVLAP